MSTRLTLAAALFAGAACGRAAGPADGGKPAGAFRVLTWNVHDLFDEVDRVEPPGQEDTLLAPAEVERKLALVGAVLRRLEPDLAVLQEVEDLRLLARLRDGPLAGAGYVDARLVDAYDPRGIDVAVISKLPVRAYVSHLGERDPTGAFIWSRDCVEVHVEVGGRALVVLGNHLVSKRSPADERRTYQAARVREIADGLAETALVLVAGDLNDEPESAPLGPLLGDGRWEDLAARLPAGEAWTYGWSGGRSRLDYLLAGPELSPLVSRVEVGSGEDVAAASDHRPVVVDLVP